jgi:hypothetical protein
MGNGALAIGPKLPRPSSTLPTETSSPDRIGPAINMKTAKALGIDIPATPLGRAAAYSLNGLTAPPHDAVSALNGRVN